MDRITLLCQVKIESQCVCAWVLHDNNDIENALHCPFVGGILLVKMTEMFAIKYLPQVLNMHK